MANRIHITRNIPLSETQIETRVRDYAKDTYGVDSTKMNVRGARGTSDVVFWFPCIPLIVEFKKPGEKPRRLQTNNLRTKRSLGYCAEWCDSLKDGLELVDGFYVYSKLHYPHVTSWEYRSEV